MSTIDYVGLLTIGEVGEANIEIQDSITSFNYELSADRVSQIKFTVHDPNFEMYNRNYFVIGRRVVYNNLEFEVAAVEINYQSLSKCVVTARTKAIQNMRRDVSRATFGNVSPTQAASAAAALFGLEFFGEATAVNGNIVRQETDGVTESTYAVLSRLAKEMDFRFFESRGTLFFASERNIVRSQPEVNLYVPSPNNDPLFVSRLNVRKSADSKKPSSFQANIIKNRSSINIFPGMSVNIVGINGFEYPFMVDRVAFDAIPNTLVNISGTSIVTIDEINCSKRTFARGSSGDCVKRIQQAINATVDGDFGPQTERLLIKFQNAKIAEGSLTLTNDEPLGTVGPATWDVIING